MNFGHNCRNSAGNELTLFGKNFSYSPLPYSGSMYNIRSEHNSLVDLSCCNSPGYRFPPNFSPDRNTPSIYFTQSVRHHPYHLPLFESFMGIYDRTHKVSNIYPGNIQDSSLIDEKPFVSQSNSYKSMKIHPNMCKAKYDDKFNFKSYTKRKRQNNFQNTSFMTKKHFPVHRMENNHHAEYGHSSLLNPLSNDEDLVNTKQEKVYSKSQMINKPNYPVGETHFPKEAIRTNINNKKLSMRNSNGPEENVFVTTVPGSITINHDTQIVTHINNISNDHENIGTDPKFRDTVTSAVLNKFDIKNSADMSSCQVTHITMPENSFCNVQDLQVENVENTDSANYFYEPIFAGKDENGEDIVILMSNSGTQSVGMTNIIDSASNNQNLGTLNQDTLKTFSLSPVQGNSTFNVQDIQQENIGNIDFANYFFEPIFEGKDETGEDIVILASNSDTQVVDKMTVIDTSGNNPCFESKDNQAALNFLVGTTGVSSETPSESQVQKTNCDVGVSMFYSHVDDYGAEETVTTSKTKYKKTKKANNRRNENTKANPLINKCEATETNFGANEFTSEPSISRENENTSKAKSQNVSISNGKFSCKGNHSHFREQMPIWRKRLLWKYNKPVINMQRAYLKRFIRKVKNENEHIMVNENFWSMYRILVTQIGGNVLQTLYNILPSLIRISGAAVQKSNDAASKQSKKPFYVKFPPKVKKQSNSEIKKKLTFGKNKKYLMKMFLN